MDEERNETKRNQNEVIAALSVLGRFEHTLWIGSQSIIEITKLIPLPLVQLHECFHFLDLLLF